MEKRDLIEQLNSFAIRIAVHLRREDKVISPELGMIKSIGDMATCLFYRKQKTRGFEDKRHFVRHLTEAIAAHVIYCFQAIYLRDCVFIQIEMIPKLNTDEKCIGILTLETGEIFYEGNQTNVIFSRSVFFACRLAEIHKIDFCPKIEDYLERMARLEQSH